MDRIMLRDDKNLLNNSGYMFLNNHLIKKPPVQKIFLNFPQMIFTFISCPHFK